jgi:hypothetical protein
MPLPPTFPCILFRIQGHSLVSNTAQSLLSHTDYFPSMTVPLTYVYLVLAPELS